MTGATVAVRFQAIVDGYQRSLQLAQRETAKLAAELDKASKGTVDLGKVSDAASRRIDQGFGRLGGALNLTGPLGRTQQSLNRTLDFAQKNERAFNTLGVTAAAAGAGAALGLKQAADASRSFESTFAGVRKTVDASEAEFSVMSRQFRDLAMDIPVTVEELNGIGEAAGQLGIANDYILGFSRTMADLGVATDLHSSAAATALARLANITQMPQQNFDRLGSTVVALGNSLAATESEIVDMGLRIAGAGSVIGLTEAQILGLAGALSDLGVRSEAGGTAISRVMVDVASSVANGGEELEQFAEIAGMSSEAFTRAWRDDAGYALATFIEGLGEVAASGGNVFSVLENIGFADVRVRDSLLRTSGAGDKLRSALDLASGAWQENIALVREAEERYSTVDSRVQIAANQINDLKIAVGDELTPIIGAGAATVGDFAEALAGLPEPVLQIGAALTGLSAAAGLGGAALLLMLPKIAQVRDAVRALELSKAGLLRAVGRFGAVGAAFGGAMWAMSSAVAHASDVTDEFAEKLGALRGSARDAESLLRGLEAAWSDLGTEHSDGGEIGMVLRQLIGGSPVATDRAKVLAEAVRSLAAESSDAAWELLKAAEAAGHIRIAADGAVTVLHGMGNASALAAEEMRGLVGAQLAASRSGAGVLYDLIDLSTAGQRAATELGLTGDAAETYAAQIDQAGKATETAEQKLQRFVDTWHVHATALLTTPDPWTSYTALTEDTQSEEKATVAA